MSFLSIYSRNLQASPIGGRAGCMAANGVYPWCSWCPESRRLKPCLLAGLRTQGRCARYCASYSDGFPFNWTVPRRCRCRFRSPLPLRVSSGFSPDSLFRTAY